MSAVIVKPARYGDATDMRFHYVPELGRTDYGDVGELMGQANAETVLAELEALGVEAFTVQERTWLCPVVAVVVDAVHPATLPYLESVAARLEAYPCLDDMRLGELELEAGYCGYCGSLGLPEWYGAGDECESCGHIVD